MRFPIILSFMMFSCCYFMNEAKPLTMRRYIVGKLLGPELLAIQKDVGELNEVVKEMRFTLNNITSNTQLKKLQAITRMQFPKR